MSAALFHRSGGRRVGADRGQADAVPAFLEQFFYDGRAQAAALRVHHNHMKHAMIIYHPALLDKLTRAGEARKPDRRDI